MGPSRGAVERVRIQIDRSEAGWWLVAAFVAGMLLLVGYRFVGTLVVGLFAYYAARPVDRRLDRHLGGTKAAVVTLVVIVVPFLVMLGGLVAAVVQQLQALGLLDVSQYARYVQPYLDVSASLNEPEQLYERARRLWDEPVVQRGLDTVLGVVGTLGSLFLHTTLVLAFVFYLLRDDEDLAAWFNEEVAERGSTLDRYLRSVDEGLSGAYFGQMLTVFVVMLVAAVVYSALNVVSPTGVFIPQPVLLAVLTGLATFVPLIGRGIVYTLVLAVLVVQVVRSGSYVALWFPGLYYLVTFFGIDSLIRYFVRPYLSGRSLHTGLMLFAYLLGAALFGWYGVFFAPLALVGALEFVRIVFPALLAGELGEGGRGLREDPSTAPDRHTPSPTGEDDTTTPTD
ncbi:AI-2E family transporter [Halomarina ordinaria]|uniref:AI-2E family transporter n=1 Tax=Halomarina ordinaria TaxID=3033939 RepID=A0ABD5U9B2_9EURY|nr:AI-2E family transporter [Halomarina sp. PSRA2]